MSQQDFRENPESYLHFSGITFSRAALLTFVEFYWSLIEENPNVDFWAGNSLTPTT